jgi:hypothetical protein
LTREALPRLAMRFNEISSEIPFAVSISNAGFVNASNVRLIITSYDGVTLLDGLKEEEAARNAKLRLISPPPPPRGGYVTTGMATPFRPPHGIFPIFGPPDRNPTRFYFASPRPMAPVEKLELTCETFPHQGDPYMLGFRAVLLGDPLGNQPRLRVRLEASNLKQPIEIFMPVSATFERGDFSQLVRELAEGRRTSDADDVG